MRPRRFAASAQVVEKFYTSPIISMVECDTQGFASSTYVVSLLDGNSIILQCRSRTDPTHEQNFARGRELLGSMVPTIRLLAKDDSIPLHFYEMSRIPGTSYSARLRLPNFLPSMPDTGQGFGELLARLCTPERMTTKSELSRITSCLEKAISSQDPLLVPFRSEFQGVLDSVNELEGLPLAFDNGDVSPTNLMVDDQGHIAGLVDWEDGDFWPLGMNLAHVHWILGKGLGEEYTLFENAQEIETRFWSSFVDHLPHCVLTIPNLRSKLQISMRLGVAGFATTFGLAPISFRLHGLRKNLAYTIPWPSSMPV